MSLSYALAVAAIAATSQAAGGLYLEQNVTKWTAALNWT